MKNLSSLFPVRSGPIRGHIPGACSAVFQLFVFTAFFVLSVAAGSGSAVSATATDPQTAQELIASAADRMLTTLEAEGDALRQNKQRIRELAEQNLLPHVDLDRMSRLVLGRSWRTATQEQRDRFIMEFRQFLLRFYAAALVDYTKGNEIPRDVMRFLPMRARAGERKVTVRSEVRQPGSVVPIGVNYHLALERGTWKVYDVSVDGISLVLNYRSSFASEIRRGGVDGLIARLAERNEQLSEVR